MSQKIHYRRCHVCGELNEAPGQLVHRCDHCGKTLAPFFYFDESKVMGLVTETRKEAESRLPLREYPPLWGLTAYWENANEAVNEGGAF
jgi:hypothetical protein